RIDGDTVTNEQYHLEVDSYETKISVGKKKHGVVRQIWT
ncbi:MAG: hypothetical protein QOJ53_1842, partial [Sphingomonadales bacterium]|nr:hypothetical protein [Sphingomonadales bacterium]